MSLKTIRAASMAEALAEVKRSIGPDAVILRTRTMKAGGVMGLGARSVVEVTASAADDAPPVIRPRRPATPPRRVETARAPSPAEGPRSETDDRRGPPEFLPAAAIRPVVHSPRRSGALDAIVTPVAPNPQNDAARAALEDELASIKRMVGQLLHVARSGAAANANGVASLPLSEATDPLFAVYGRLVEAELAPSLADHVLAAARRELTDDEARDPEVARATFVRLLAERIPVGSQALRSPRRGARVAFVGPTGVGKTTTIAKLAATFQLRQNRSVGLITSDTFRIAAVDQLRTYAQIIGVPLRVALTPEEMAAAVESMADRDLVLIDTAGRSPSDTARLEELTSFVRASKADSVCLTVSATISERSLRSALERFAALDPGAVALTKTDEAETLGPAINALADFDRPIALLSTGQEVPDQFEWAQASRLAAMLIDGPLGRDASVEAPRPARDDEELGAA